MRFREKEEKIAAAFAEMQDLHSYRLVPEKFSALLRAMSDAKEVPSHMEGYTLQQIHSAATSLMYDLATVDVGCGIEVGYFMD